MCYRVCVCWRPRDGVGNDHLNWLGLVGYQPVSLHDGLSLRLQAGARDSFKLQGSYTARLLFMGQGRVSRTSSSTRKPLRKVARLPRHAKTTWSSSSPSSVKAGAITLQESLVSYLMALVCMQVYEHIAVPCSRICRVKCGLCDAASGTSVHPTLPRRSPQFMQPCKVPR